MSGLSPEERRVFDHLVAAIAERTLAPGVRLVEEELAQAFDVNRGRIRKVLLALSQMQVVHHAPNRGAQVARLSREEARGVIDARLLIEPELAQRVASLPDAARAAAVARLAVHLAQERAVATDGTRGEALRLSGRFHVIVCELAGNAVLGDIVDRLVLLSSLGLATHAPAVVSDHCGPHEHEAIVAAIARGAADEAAALTAAHLSKIGEVLGQAPRTARFRTRQVRRIEA